MKSVPNPKSIAPSALPYLHLHSISGQAPLTFFGDTKNKFSRFCSHRKFFGSTLRICSINDYQYEEIISCDSIKNHIVHQDDKGIVWKIKHITAHEEPLNVHQTNHKGD